MAAWNDRIVVITGATSGIGRATADVFRRAGARVVGTGRDPQRLLALATAGFDAVEMDVTSDDAVARACDAILAKHGRVDVVVNNAGIGLFRGWEESPPAEVARILDTNLLGVVRVTHRLLPQMIARDDGVIVNVASVAGKRGYPRHTAYCASKHALVGWSEALRCDLERTGVGVVVVCPPAVRTPFFDNAGYPTFDEDHRGFVPMTAEAVADGILDATTRRTPQVILSPRAKLLYAVSVLAPGVVPRLRRWKTR